jgi:acetyl-CoA carboxylase biotin carboxyl carrier protein
MSNVLSSMNDDEVRQIALLVETLDKSTFDYLQIGVGNLQVTIGKGIMAQTATMSAVSCAATTGMAAIPAPAQSVATPAASSAPAPASVSAQPAAQPAAQVATKVVPAEDGTAEDGTVYVVAPMMGRFYAKPEPGSAPFVSIGSAVEKDATVGLIEIMKVFNAVQAGVKGVVTEICVQDAQFIEFGQVLFRIRPA